MSLPASDLNKQADGRTTMELGKVLPLTAEVKDDHLFIGGCDMVEVAKEFGTALYVFDQADLEARMDEYVQSFKKYYGDRAEVAYASKAFQNKAIVKLANEHGMCLDVSGGGELACALAAGFPAKRVIVHGNNKTPQELREAIEAGVGCIVVDSRIELGRISAIAQELGVTQDIYLRITPGVEADTHEFIRTGCEDSKFGFTMRDDFAFKCIKNALETPGVRLTGLHCHIGSQIFALHSFREAIDVKEPDDYTPMWKHWSLSAVPMIPRRFGIKRINDEYHYEIEGLDLGGGLGIAYVAEEEPPTIESFAKLTCTAVKELCVKYGVKEPRIAVEPGRSIAATPGVTLYTVGILKTLPGIRNIVAIDGGMSDNIRTALYGADYEPVIANKAGQPRTKVVTLVGKHCESGDAVAANASIQNPDLGDIVCMFGTGAYCHSMSSRYNGQPRPGIVFVKDGQARLVTRRETYADLMSCDL